jgi:uncharacterized protein (TIGR02246 family)
MGSAEGSVAAFYQKLAAAWSANNGSRFAAFFTEDGSLINPFGQRVDGRQALTAMYSEYFGGMLKGHDNVDQLDQCAASRARSRAARRRANDIRSKRGCADGAACG